MNNVTSLHATLLSLALLTCFKIQNVPIFNNIIPAFLEILAGRPDGRLGAAGVESRVRHALSADEGLLKVRVDSRENWGVKGLIICYNCVRQDGGEETYTPAACGALVPLRMVHARTCCGPQVKKLIKSRALYPVTTISEIIEESRLDGGSFDSKPAARVSSSRPENGMRISPG